MTDKKTIKEEYKALPRWQKTLLWANGIGFVVPLVLLTMGLLLWGLAIFVAAEITWLFILIMIPAVITGGLGFLGMSAAGVLFFVSGLIIDGHQVLEEERTKLKDEQDFKARRALRSDPK